MSMQDGSVLLVGGTGRVGVHLVRALERRGVRFQVMTRDMTAAAAKLGPEVPLVRGDLATGAGLECALKDSDRLFLLTANSPEQVELEINAVRAARRAGIRHIVKVSGLRPHADRSRSVGYWHHCIERYIEDSGVGYTFLRPAFFMQNFFMYAGDIQVHGRLPSPVSRGAIACVDARDVAEVAAVMLASNGHDSGVYTLTGPAAVTFDQVADAIGRVTGTPVRHQPIEFDAAKARMRQLGMPPWLADYVITLYEDFDAGKDAEVSADVSAILGRPPRGVDQFAAEHAEVFGSARRDRTAPPPRSAELGRWALEDLPDWNRRLLGSECTPADFRSELNCNVLSQLPPPEAYSTARARKALVNLGLIGASVGRHEQERDPALLKAPHRAFDGLFVGTERIPYLEYFERLAEVSGTGHPARDAYASLVRWNTPTAEVQWEGEVIAALPGAFEDGRVRTYTGSAGEILFFELLKKAEALELAVNELLEPLSAGKMPLTSKAALNRVDRATFLLGGIHRLNLEFSAGADDGGFSADFFIDVFRQFAIHWRAGDVPPSGAEDPEYLKRDLMLGIDFPDYGDIVRRVFPALLDEERDCLDRLSRRRSIPEVLEEQLHLDPRALRQSARSALETVVRRHRSLAHYYFLLLLNARVAASHLMLTKKFLFKPARARAAVAMADNLLVSRNAGTTGMPEALLERLARARKNHRLVVLGRIGHSRLADLGGAPGIPQVNAGKLADLVRFQAGPP